MDFYQRSKRNQIDAKSWNSKYRLVFKVAIDQKIIINKINQQDFDFLIVTENIEEFTFSERYFAYHSDKIPLDS